MNSRPFPISFDHRKWGPSMIAGTYLLIGALWILFSDQFAARIAPNQIVLTQISIYKGWGYVLVTALLLYWLILRHTGRVSAIDRNYRLISENASDVIWILDPARGLFKYVSPSVQKLRGYTPEEVMAQPMIDALTSDSLERINTLTATRISQFQAQGSGTASYIDEVDQPRKDGSVVNTEVTTTYLFNEQGGIEIVGVTRDISERKQAMRKLSESEQNYQELLEQASDGIFIADSNGQYTIVNEEACRLVGYTREELLSMKIQDMVAPEDLEKTPLRFDELRDGKTLITERKFVHKNGSWILCEISAKMLPDGRFQSIVRDITERKVTGEALVKSEKRYRSLFENMTNGFARCQMLYDNGKPSDFIYLDVNNAFRNLTGLSDVIGRRVTEIVPGIRESNPELFEIYGRVASTRKPERFETYVPELRSGIWFSISVYSPEKNFFVAVFETITERKQAEEALRQSEQKFSILFEKSAFAASLSRLPDGVMVDVNEAFEKVFGYTRQEVIGRTSMELDINPDPESRARILAALKEYGSAHNQELTLHTKSGEVRSFSTNVDLVDIGDQKYILNTTQDTTERKKAEVALRESEERLRLSLHAGNQGLYDLNVQTGDAIVNREYAQMLGYDPNTFVETNAAWIERLHPEDREITSKAYSDYINGLTPEYRVEFRQRTKEGGWKWILSLGKVVEYDPIGKPLRMLGTHTDITELKEAEKEIQLKDNLLHLTSEMAKVGGWEFDAQTLAGNWTDEVARIHDLKPGDPTNVELGMRFYLPESREKIEKAVKEAIELARPYDLELEMVSAKGIHKWVRTMALPIVDDEKVVKVRGIFQDISERKHAEEALQRAYDELDLKVQERTVALSQANALLQALMDYTPDQIYFKDTQSRFIRNSRSQANMLGLSDPAEAVGKTDFDFFPHAQRAYEEEQEIISSGKPLVDFEEWVVWPDGRETWVSTTKMPLRNTNGENIGIFGISRDITERKRTEQAIRQLNADLETQAAQLKVANKELEAFSYSVSHDLRTPLRAINGYTRILLEDYEPLLDEEGKRVCSIINKEAQRMGQLIDDLLTFSRLSRKEIHTSRIDMKVLANSVFKELVKELDTKHIDFEIGKLAPAAGDPALIRQVWVNLLANAIKFTSGKKRAVIEVGSTKNKHETVYYVRDNGAGFEMEYADKLFGVFQRLHSESEFEGTGVGLAIVQRVIHRHGGRVWAEGKVDEGAVFYFALPQKGEK